MSTLDLAQQTIGRGGRRLTFRPRRGSVLLLSLMIMAVTLAVSLNLVVLINLGIGTSTVSKNALVVFYQAESGLERALFRVRQLKVLPSDLGMGTGTSCDCGGLCPAIPGCTVTPDNKVGLAQTTAIWLRQDQSLEVDLLDPDGTIYAGVNELRILCLDVNTSPDPGGSLVVTATRVDSTGGWGVSEGAVTQEVFLCPESVFGGIYISGPALGLQGQGSYLVNIRAVQSDVTILSVRAKDINGNDLNLFDHLELTASAGNFISRQQLTLAMPGRVHASGLFPYVLYSECSLDKFPAGPSANSCP